MGDLRNFYIGMRNRWPYTDFHELNADWMIVIIEQLIDEVENFVSQNAIKYADPIQWDITSQYEKNTVVVDPVTGTAYLSSKPVPRGVSLSNTYYWSVIFDLGRFITLAAQNFAISYEAVPTTTATMPTDEGHWVVWDSVLYQALNDIHIGDRYVIDGNIEKKTVEDFFNILANNIAEEVQTRADEDIRIKQELTDLITSKVNIEAQTRSDEDIRIEQELTDLITSKVDLEAQARTNAINTEAQARANADGVLSNLNTSNKNNLVGAINEVNNRVGGEILAREAGDHNIMQVLNQFANRRVVILTDSYGNVPAGNSFYNVFLNLTGLTNNDNAFLFAYNGCGFVGNTDSWQNTFIQSGDVDTVTYRDTITDVYVLGGCNDVNQSELDILEAGQTLFNSLRLKFQKANIYIGMFGQTLNPATLDKWQIIKNCYDNMNLYGYQVISGASTWLRYESYFSDYNHPNANGARYLGKALFNHFKNKGDTQLKYNRPVAATVEGSGIASNADAVIMNINTTINNDVVEAFTTGTCRISKASGMTLATNGNYTEIATIAYSFMLGGVDNECITPVVVQLDAGGTYYTTIAMIKIYKGKIYLALYPVNGGSSITVQHIRMLPFKIISNSMSL